MQIVYAMFEDFEMGRRYSLFYALFPQLAFQILNNLSSCDKDKTSNVLTSTFEGILSLKIGTIYWQLFVLATSKTVLS